METKNCCFVQPDVLAEICRVIDDGYTAGPAFVNAFGSFVDAVVIHDRVYVYGLVDGLANPGLQSPWSIVKDSPLIAALIDQGILADLNQDDVESRLRDVNSGYSLGEFLADNHWSQDSFLASGPSSEESWYRNWLDVINTAPAVLSEETLVDDIFGQISRVSARALPLLTIGFNANDLRILEGLNRRIRGYHTLASSLRMNLYCVSQAFPHQIGAIRHTNTIARSTYEKLRDKTLKLLDTDDIVGDEDYKRIAMPPLSQLLISKCKDQRSALTLELLDLRHRHDQLRAYLGAFEESWDNARTREDARRLNAEFASAFENLAKRETEPSTRFLYKIWDIVKDPTKILEKLGDELARSGRQHYAISRISGLRNFYEDVARSPLPRHNHSLLTSLFGKIAPDSTWRAASDLGSALETRLLVSDQGNDGAVVAG